MLERFEAGDVAYMRALTYEEVEERGGHGGHEALNCRADGRHERSPP